MYPSLASSWSFYDPLNEWPLSWELRELDFSHSSATMGYVTLVMPQNLSEPPFPLM